MHGTKEMSIPKIYLDKWQEIMNIAAELISVPAGLIMRIAKEDIEVFISSKSDSNPYHPGDHDHFLGSGLYCETVVTTNDKLLVPDALADENWKNNPDIKLNMIAYLGYPILYPDGDPFGTICVLDNKANAFSQTYEKLLVNFRDIIQNQIELLHMNQILGEEKKSLTDYIEEIQQLRGIIPICMHCKKIRQNDGYWKAVEVYIAEHSEASFSHGVCEDCMRLHYSEFLDK